MIPLAAFSGRYLDYTFLTRGGARVRIVERPSRWMDAPALAELLDDLRAVVRRAVPAGSLDYGVVTGNRECLDAAILTIVYDEVDARPVAFNALSILDCELHGRPIEVLHLGLGAVDPAYRGRGMSGILYGLTCFLIFARRSMRPLWISNVTQVPAVFGVVAEAFTRVFPTPDATARRSFDHLSLGRQILSRHRRVFGVGPEAGFDEARFVITNAYTGGSDNLKKSFADAPKHRAATYNDYCARELSYPRGDDFLQIGQWTLGTALGYFTRSRSVISPTSMAMRFGFLLLESLVAPVLQWFDASRGMGELRPWGEPRP